MLAALLASKALGGRASRWILSLCSPPLGREGGQQAALGELTRGAHYCPRNGEGP